MLNLLDVFNIVLSIICSFFILLLFNDFSFINFDISLYDFFVLVIESCLLYLVVYFIIGGLKHEK